MRKKRLIAALVFAIALPFAAAYGATNSSGTDCGSAPTRPATGATTAEMQQFWQQRQTYNKCMGTTGGMGRGWGMGRGLGAGEGDNANLQANGQDRCALINQRITSRINNFQNNQNNDKSIFGNLYDNLNNIQTRISNAGIDTTTLQKELPTLQTDIGKVNTDYASFISNLQTVQSSSSTCGQSGGQFMANLKAARTILATVRTDRLAVRSYVTSTIFPEIKTLRQQLQDKVGSGPSATSSN